MPLLAEVNRAKPELIARANTDALFVDHPAYFAVVGRL